MKLTELDPRWLTFEGRRVGLIFKSPKDPEWRQAVFFECFPLFRCPACRTDSEWHCGHSQAGIVKAAGLDQDGNVQYARKDFAWTCTPPAGEASFDNISVTPSIDGSAGGLWHGWITKGEIR